MVRTSGFQPEGRSSILLGGTGCNANVFKKGASMSYDVYMEVDVGGESPSRVSESFNYTSNVNPIWTKALGGEGLRDLEGMTGEKAQPFLVKAICHMAAHPEVYKPMEPENGWGNYHGAMNFLTRILQICQENPKAKVGMSY
jgi:hypothetical protein